MKKSNLVLVICLIVVVVIGWFAVGSQIVSKNSNYATYIKEADDWVERGLYQRAISNYNLAAEEKETAQLYEKIDNAYKLRYKEAPEETLDDYMDFLEVAVSKYPGNTQLVDSFIEVYYYESKFEDIYNCIIKALDSGYKGEKAQPMLLKAKYATSLRRSEFAGLKQSECEYYSAARNDGWNIYNIGEGYMLTNEYEYVSQCNKDGIFVVTGEDSRIMDATRMVLGIFKEKITDAGLFADDLIPACSDGKYKYYNDLAEAQFGDYEMASAFQNGVAAVKKDGKWYLIDKKGKVKSDAFDEIVLDYLGRYMIDDVIVAKSDGKYGLYDENMKLKTSLDCSDIDCYTSDKKIAICKDGKWGFVNSSGKVIIEPTYENAKSFSNGLAAVMKDGKWGFINSDGTLVIECEYAEVGYMNEDGVCPVRIILPEDKVEKNEDEENKEPIKVNESWKFLELELGIKED